MYNIFRGKLIVVLPHIISSSKILQKKDFIRALNFRNSQVCFVALIILAMETWKGEPINNLLLKELL